MSKINSLFKTLELLQVIFASLRSVGLDPAKIASSVAKTPQASASQDFVASLSKQGLDLKAVSFKTVTIPVPVVRSSSSPPKKQKKKSSPS